MTFYNFHLTVFLLAFDFFDHTSRISKFLFNFCLTHLYFNTLFILKSVSVYIIFHNISLFLELCKLSPPCKQFDISWLRLNLSNTSNQYIENITSITTTFGRHTKSIAFPSIRFKEVFFSITADESILIPL